MLSAIAAIFTGGGGAIISALGGGILRLIPELIGLWNKKTDNAHELAMLDKQFQLEMARDKQKADADYQMTHLTTDSAALLAALDAQKSALADQMRPTGIALVDALSSLVRPLTTYYFLLCYGVFKFAILWVAMHQMDPWKAIIQCYTVDDLNIMFGILGFWFVGRKFEKSA